MLFDIAGLTLKEVALWFEPAPHESCPTVINKFSLLNNTETVQPVYVKPQKNIFATLRSS
jgi:hypothetical protein